MSEVLAPERVLELVRLLGREVLARGRAALVIGIRYPVVARGHRTGPAVLVGHAPEERATGVDALLVAQQEYE